MAVFVPMAVHGQSAKIFESEGLALQRLRILNRSVGPAENPAEASQVDTDTITVWLDRISSLTSEHVLQSFR